MGLVFEVLRYSLDQQTENFRLVFLEITVETFFFLFASFTEIC